MIRKVSLVLLGAALGATIVIALSQPRFIVGNPAIAAAADTYRQLNLFGDVFERVRTDYVDKPEEKKLIEAAITGMLTSLDPHSGYLNPESFRDMQVQTSGEFGGLGIEVTKEKPDDPVKVVTPIDDTPAHKAGILSGDLITDLDGESVLGITLEDAVNKMRGPVGTTITLTVSRQGAQKPLKIKITRAKIKLRPVRHRVEKDVGYIRVTSFNRQTDEGLQKAVEAIRREVGKDLKGFILDLRNNPGGLLDQAVAVSDEFLDKGEIVSTRGRNSDDSARRNARSGDIAAGMPIIVLINGGSASASEIVAGALQDHRRATVVGTRSFGKGSVQTIIPLGANGAIRLTTARYYTPAGRSIQALGINPDIEVKQALPPELKGQEDRLAGGESKLRGHLSNEKTNGEKEESGSLHYVPPDPKNDAQLNYALDLLRGIKVNQAFPPDPETGVPN